MAKKIFAALLIICGLAAFHPCVGAASNLKFEPISIARGLSQGSVRCIFQDSRGFLWFGTTNGLNKYDGYRFTIYTHNPADQGSLSHSNISAIVEDKKGTLWIGTLGKGLNRFDRRKETFNRYTHQRGNPGSLSSNTISTIYVDHTGVLWVGTYGGGLNRYNEKDRSFTYFMPKPGETGSIRPNTVSCILEDRTGHLLVGTYAGLLIFERESETFTGWKEPVLSNVLNTLGVHAIWEDSAGTLWVGARSGLYRVSQDRKDIAHLPFKSRVPMPGPNLIFALYEDRDGDIWIGTTDWGLFIYHRETGNFSQYIHDPQNPHSLSKNYIYTIMEDNSGVIWLGTEGGGANKYDRLKEKFVHHRKIPDSTNHLNHNSVYALCEDRNGHLWIGTNGGGLNRFDRKTGGYKYYTHREGDSGSLAHDYVSCIYEDRTGMLWVGTYGKGLDKLDPQKETFTHYRLKENTPGGLSSGSIACLCEDRYGYLWVGTKNGGLNRMDRETETFHRFTADPAVPGSISSNAITVVFPDSRGILWVGTRNEGLNRFNRQSKFNGPGGDFTHYKYTPNAPSLNHNGIKCICESRDGILWAGTDGGGLNRFDPKEETFAAFTTKNGLADDVVYGILEDKNGNLWLSTNRGISRFTPATGVFKNYSPRDGLQDYEFSTGAYHKNKNGEMFFGGFYGFNSFVPELVKDNPFVPPVVITGFYIFNKPVEIGRDSPLKKHINVTGEIVLSYRENIFSFDFAALDYTDPAKNLFQYMVEGFNDKWIHLGTKHDITFTDLDPGSYTLKIRGSNNDSVWNNEGTSIKIIIKPPYWQTWWFQSLLVLSIAAGALTWHKRRMDNLSLRLKTEAEMQRIFDKYKVSKREQEIIQLMLKGKSNKDIEDELYISMKTVKSHVYNIYQKLGVKNRLELIHLIQRSINGK